MYMHVSAPLLRTGVGFCCFESGDVSLVGSFELST